MNLGPNESERIVVYDGDNPQELALRFCEEHDLDEETQVKLEIMLEQQIANVLTKIEEEETNSNHSNN